MEEIGDWGTQFCRENWGVTVKRESYSEELLVPGSDELIYHSFPSALREREIAQELLVPVITNDFLTFISSDIDYWYYIRHFLNFLNDFWLVELSPKPKSCKFFVFHDPEFNHSPELTIKFIYPDTDDLNLSDLIVRFDREFKKFLYDRVIDENERLKYRKLQKKFHFAFIRE